MLFTREEKVRMGWICKFCSTNNSNDDSNCIVCDAQKPYRSVCTLTRLRTYNLNLSGDVIVPPEFNVIGEGAFKDRLDITGVVLHPNVSKIMQSAFSGCKNLTYVYIQGKLEYIGSKAFFNCSSLPISKRPHANRIASDAFGECQETINKPEIKNGQIGSKVLISNSMKVGNKPKPLMSIIARVVMIIIALIVIITALKMSMETYQNSVLKMIIGVVGSCCHVAIMLVILRKLCEKKRTREILSSIILCLSCVEFVILFIFPIGLGAIVSMFEISFILCFNYIAFTYFMDRRFIMGIWNSAAAVIIFSILMLAPLAVS